MRTPRIPDPALAVMSVLSARGDDFWPGLLDELAEAFGPVETVSETYPFNETSYYDQELGTPIFRRILGFERLLPLDGLAGFKLAANALELAHALPDGRRIFNLDPGLLNQERLVLASLKNFPHRIYQSDGVWADLTLTWNRNRWQTHPWTFPDYAGPDLRKYLTELRSQYKKKLCTLN